MKAITIYSGGSVMTGQGREYYPAAEVDAYRRKVAALVEAAKGARQLECYCSDERMCFHCKLADSIDAAIAALEGE